MTPPARWLDLRRLTPARVALGRVGNGVPTEPHLAFQADHAAARDAVHAALDVDALRAAISRECHVVHSAAPDRATYLRRPDLGRRLAAGTVLPEAPGQVAIVLADGLSAIAVQRHAPALVAALALPGPIVIATQARVALGDAVGEAMRAEAVVVLIGERPGLSAADSVGAYLTWRPRIGRTDAERNCISNIRPEGLAIPLASRKILWLLGEMRRLGLSGVALKDEAPDSAMSLHGGHDPGAIGAISKQ